MIGVGINTIWFVFFAFIIVIVLMWIAAIKAANERRDSMQGYAMSKGAGFKEKIKTPKIVKDMFKPGWGISVRNYISGISAGGYYIDIFDCSYSTNNGRYSQKHTYTCAMLKSNAPIWRNIPQFRLEPENFLIRFIDKFTGKDIDFDNYPQFSQAYRLTGKDVFRIRYFFKPALIERLENSLEVYICSDSKDLLFCRHGRIDSSMLEAFEGEVRSIIQLMALSLAS